jgi:hypothetical protein
MEVLSTTFVQLTNFNLSLLKYVSDQTSLKR